MQLVELEQLTQLVGQITHCPVVGETVYSVPLQAWQVLLAEQTKQLGSGQGKQLPLKMVTTEVLPLKRVLFAHWAQKLGCEQLLHRVLVQLSTQEPLVRT